MTTHTEVAEVLDSAADYIEQHGWCQGRRQAPTGEVCLLGAIARVAQTGEVRHATSRALFNAQGNYVVWNDTHGRTEQEVLDLLRATAKSELRLADEAGER